jgi:peptidoglycan/LPS O-acetylase OafA/YrhL
MRSYLNAGTGCFVVLLFVSCLPIVLIAAWASWLAEEDPLEPRDWGGNPSGIGGTPDEPTR